MSYNAVHKLQIRLLVSLNEGAAPIDRRSRLSIILIVNSKPDTYVAGVASCQLFGPQLRFGQFEDGQKMIIMINKVYACDPISTYSLYTAPLGINNKCSTYIASTFMHACIYPASSIHLIILPLSIALLQAIWTEGEKRKRTKTK